MKVKLNVLMILTSGCFFNVSLAVGGNYAGHYVEADMETRSSMAFAFAEVWEDSKFRDWYRCAEGANSFWSWCTFGAGDEATFDIEGDSYEPMGAHIDACLLQRIDLDQRYVYHHTFGSCYDEI